jgi:hypothetical protein
VYDRTVLPFHASILQLYKPHVNPSIQQHAPNISCLVEGEEQIKKAKSQLFTARQVKSQQHAEHQTKYQRKCKIWRETGQVRGEIQMIPESVNKK